MQEAKNKLAIIENEIERRKKLKLCHYNVGEKIHQKQVEFHKCQKRNRWVFGGNRSGKTECGAVETVWLARGIHPYRQNKKDISCWVVSLSNQVQRDVAQQKILSYLDPTWIAEVSMLSGKKTGLEYGVIDYIIIKNVFGGTSKIGFKSCEAGREKFQGTSLDFVWFDEEPPKDIYEECKMRVLDKKGDIFGTMTPLKGLTFIYDEIYLNKYGSDQVWCTFMEWADNPYLDKDEVEQMTSTLSKDALDSRRYGRFSASVGLVYPEFDPSVHVIEPFDIPLEWQDVMSIDPGLNNPLSCHWYAVDYDGNIYVVAEHYDKGKDIYWHADKIKQKCRQLNWHTDSFGKYVSLIDSAANQRTLASSKSVAELFCENGINVNTKVNKDVFSGINRVKGYLMSAEGKPRLFIFNTCINMIREIKSYWWGENDSPKKVDDHSMDELRYYVCSKPEASKNLKPKTAIQKDKDTLLRKLRYSK